MNFENRRRNFSNISLSSRLLKIAQLITPCHALLDIGFDHAQLLIYLIQNNYIQVGYGIEKRLAPFKSGIMNVNTHGLTDHIHLFLTTDENDEIFQKIEYIVIAGLGSSTVINILKTYLKHIDKQKIVIQLSKCRQIYALRK